jgi:hypothetical protein
MVTRSPSTTEVKKVDDARNKSRSSTVGPKAATVVEPVATRKVRKILYRNFFYGQRKSTKKSYVFRSTKVNTYFSLIDQFVIFYQVSGTRDTASTTPPSSSFLETVTSLMAWGQNNDNRLGVKTEEEFVGKPTAIDTLKAQGVTVISCGNSTNTAVTADGRVYTWGKNAQLLGIWVLIF